VVCLLAAAIHLRGQTTILHLKNGDRLAGTIVSEDTNRVVITTVWIKELAVPVTAIEGREIIPPFLAVTNAPAAIAAGKAPSSTAGPAVTNATPSIQAGMLVGVTTVPSLHLSRWRYWKGEARFGASFLYGVNNQQIYTGRFKLTYQRPYAANPKHFFRNILDYSVDYGWTSTPEGTNTILSANRMDLSDKTDFDIGSDFYIYNLASTGYDEVRKIDSRFEIGPGIGYHLFTAPNFVVNVESGIDYQAEYRVGSSTNNTLDLSYRAAEDLTWKMGPRYTLIEKLEFLPRISELANQSTANTSANAIDYRLRFEATLSYGFWKNLSLNLSVSDLYDTRPAPGIPNNDLQIRSSVGITF
jgi:hypothetical protein